ncbi:hypothetical protein GF385_00325 [Candidatus Dependentiae bacterium]|nr:hypothetical protein [Candidatus Dependentiae bacterium]
MKYKEIYFLVFSVIFLLLANFLNNFVRTTNYVDPFQDIDSKGYIYNAEMFYKHGTFLKGQNAPYFSLGYPAFMGLVYKYFKPKNNSVVWVQIFLALFTCFFIFYSASFIFGHNIGIVAFILSTINIGFITFSNFILAETLLTFLLSLFLLLFILFLRKKKLFYVFFSGLVLGISIFVKPAAIYFILPILLLIAYLSNGMRIKAIILFALSFYLPVFSYMYYNKVNFGYFSIAPLGNENLYLYLYPKVLAKKNNTNMQTEQKKLSKMLEGSKLNPKSWVKIKKQFKKDFKKKPRLFISIWLKNVLKTFLGLYTTNLKVLTNKYLDGGDLSFFKIKGTFFKRVKKYINSGTKYFTIRLIGSLEAFWTILRYFLVLLGFIFLLIKREFKYFFFLLFYIFYFSMITGHDGCARFRMMFEPALIILASQGLFIIYYRLRYKSCPLGEL